MDSQKKYRSSRPSSSVQSATWGDDGKWKKRYSKLYTTRRRSLLGYDTNLVEDTTRISFLSDDSTPYTNLLRRIRGSQEQASQEPGASPAPATPMSSKRPTAQSSDLGGHDTTLLDLVRGRSRSQDTQNTNTNVILPAKEEDDAGTDQESCLRGMMNIRVPTERSMSRSRVSRISTRRDMDIPSLMAFNVDEGYTSTRSKLHTHLEIPAFQMAATPATEPIPRWSIRRSVCPVCSQKWKDRSSLGKIRYSGFKRKSSLDLLSVVAPARLRTSITLKYAPRPTPVASDQEAGVIRGRLRNNSTTWQLTRARRFRIPKINLPPEATAPPVFIEPMVRKDLDNRVQKFLRT